MVGWGERERERESNIQHIGNRAARMAVRSIRLLSACRPNIGQVGKRDWFPCILRISNVQENNIQL